MSVEKFDTPEQKVNIINSLTGFANILGQASAYCGSPLSQTNPMFYNNRWYLISNNRQLLSEMYVEHGIVQTLVEQPVDDAFRSGFEIKTGQLDGEEIEKLMIYLERDHVIKGIAGGIKWARLFGGGAVLIITDQDPSTPLDLNAITEDSLLKFRAVDMWELYQDMTNINIAMTSEYYGYYNYYGIRVHPTRVLRIVGKEAPSFVRPRLRGWGMSELERLIRSLNQYLKNQDVIYELLDEAKVDVYKIDGFNNALATDSGTNNVAKRIQTANLLKNYNSALTMDVNDDYEQKQMTFTGLAEMLTQIRYGLAADLKMPVEKLFGIQSTALGSNEAAIENYNSMVESDVRSKVKFIMIECIQVCCKKLFNFIPDDLSINFNPLRILNAVDQEVVKNHQFNRVMATYNTGLVSDLETKESLNKASLLPVEVDETKAAEMRVGEFESLPASENLS